MTGEYMGEYISMMGEYSFIPRNISSPDEIQKLSPLGPTDTAGTLCWLQSHAQAAAFALGDQARSWGPVPGGPSNTPSHPGAGLACPAMG